MNKFPNSKIGRKGFQSGYTDAHSYDADALAYFTAAGIPTTAGTQTERRAVDAFIVGCKADSLWTKFYRCFLMSPYSASAALYCAKTAGNPMTNVNSVTWNANGFTTNGVTSYINTNYNPVAQFTTTSGFACVYIRTDVVDNLGTLFGSYDGATGRSVYASGGDGTGMTSIIFYDVDLGGSGSVAFPGPAWGLIGVYRAATDEGGFIYRDSGTGANLILEETKLPPSLSIFLGAYNDSGSPNGMNPINYSAAIFGGTISFADELNLNTRIEAYQTALGRNVA